MNSLKNKTLLITGASRGIGKAIALRAAADGARIAIAAKSTQEDPRIPGTIYSAAEEIERAGGQALPIVCDIRHEDQVERAVHMTVERFGGIDILVNNASAISLTGTEMTAMKRYDLMHQINLRGTFLCSQKAIPHLRKANNPHVLVLSPPLSMKPQWFGPHVAYTIAKYGMSMCVMGMAEEYRGEGIAFNALWPRTTIATAAVRNIAGGEEMIKYSRNEQIMADAAYAILTSPARETTGNFFIDEHLLRARGQTNFDQYAMVPGNTLMTDLYVDE